MTGFAVVPLAEEGPDELDKSQWLGTARILGPQWSHLSTLTLCFLGVQLFWSIEMSYASPYLLSLGLSKSSMAMVFLAGPLSGLIVQPLVGVLADNSKSRFGRRRPYMIGGSVICVAAMLLLGYTRSISSIFTAIGTYSNDVLTIWLAVLAIFCIDFSINAVQATNRALLVDTLPTAEQAGGNAWAARMLGIGSVAGFFVGNIDMTRVLPFLGSEQLEVMSVVASFLLLCVQCTTSVCVKERVLLSSIHSGEDKHGFVREMQLMFKNIFTLPRVIRKIFMIQFFSSIAWFPLLFYTTVYIGELHKRASPLGVDSDAAADALEAEANRLGSRALFYSAIISLVTNVILPFFVCEASYGEARRRSCFERVQVSMVTIWTTSYAVFVGCMAATLFTSSVFGATWLIAITGFSWAIAQWAPYSLLGEAILTEHCVEDDRSIRLMDARTSRISEGEDEGEEERGFLEEEEVGHEYDEGEERSGGLSGKAGIILGIHNIFIVIPQFLVTGLASIVFAIVEPDKSVVHGHHPGIITHNGTSTGTKLGREVESSGGPNSVAIIFRIGGVSAAIAFVLCLGLRRELRHR